MKSFLDIETVLEALEDAAWVAEHGSREEKSGRFLPPGWKGQLITGTDADRLPKAPIRRRADKRSGQALPMEAMKP